METRRRWPKLVGGDAALDFANTAIAATGDPNADVLTSAEEFVAWCSHAGLELSAAAQKDSDVDVVLDECRRLRLAILQIATAYATDGDPAVGAAETLQARYADAVRRARPITEGPLKWTWAEQPPSQQAMFLLTDAAVELFRHGALARLKACDSCHFVYLDASKNNSRRWCSMDDCGKQEKMQRYVARRAAATRVSGDPRTGGGRALAPPPASPRRQGRA